MRAHPTPSMSKLTTYMNREITVLGLVKVSSIRAYSQAGSVLHVCTRSITETKEDATSVVNKITLRLSTSQSRKRKRATYTIIKKRRTICATIERTIVRHIM